VRGVPEAAFCRIRATPFTRAAPERMAEPQPTARDYLEQARELVWEAIQKLEEAQRVLFHAGDRYVGQVWGDGVRAVIEITERMADLSGDVTATHIEIGRLDKRDASRGPEASK
jgi:hypothetical protein